MGKKKILVVEDDRAISNLIQMTLQLYDYEYKVVMNGLDALKLSVTMQPDLVILDLGLPDIEGIEVIEKIRSWSSLPIIVVSARAEENDKIKALDMGADDYVTKPFSVEELLARIRVALRRIRDEETPALPIFNNGPLTIDYPSNSVWLNEEEIHLTPNEYKLLEILSRNVGKVLTHNYLLKEIWPDSLDSDIPNLRVFMATLRKKLAPTQATPTLIQTHIRIGYRMLHIE